MWLVESCSLPQSSTEAGYVEHTLYNYLWLLWLLAVIIFVICSLAMNDDGRNGIKSSYVALKYFNFRNPSIQWPCYVWQCFLQRSLFISESKAGVKCLCINQRKMFASCFFLWHAVLFHVARRNLHTVVQTLSALKRREIRNGNNWSYFCLPH